MPPPTSGSVGPINISDCESLAGQLLDPAVGSRRKLDIAIELRDSAENNRDYSFYEKYLAVLVPCVITVLSDEKTINFARDSFDQVSITRS